MATFLEVVADTGLVSEACRVVEMHRSGAYALQSRDPVFAAAWRAAKMHARPQVADGLLERSITGTVEHYYRDGVLVGERRHYESWLGLAVLKRLDKQAEEDCANASLSARMAADWMATLDAVRAGGTAAVHDALESKVDEVDIPPSPPGLDPFGDVWRNDDGAWMTTHAPPPGFDGEQNREWNGFDDYRRACTPEEAALLDAHEAAMIEQERRELEAYADAERNRFFDMLRSELADAAELPGGVSETSRADQDRHAELGSASISGTGNERDRMDPETSSG